jgi:tripartite-type tricarboxylate transporter receptor subunit TctC
MFAPKGTPEKVTTRLREVLNQAAHSDLFKAAVANLGQELAYQDQPEFAKFWDEDAARIEAAVREIGRVQG